QVVDHGRVVDSNEHGLTPGFEFAVIQEEASAPAASERSPVLSGEAPAASGPRAERVIVRRNPLDRSLDRWFPPPVHSDEGYLIGYRGADIPSNEGMAGRSPSPLAEPTSREPQPLPVGSLMDPIA